MAVLVAMSSCARKTVDKSLPRGEASEELNAAFESYLAAVEESGLDVHSIMIVQHGKVLEEAWRSEGHPDSLHILNSVSKTFTATAVGFAVSEGLLSVEDTVISFFPDELPDYVSENLAKMQVKHLLTMTGGHDTDPTGTVLRGSEPVDNWAEYFLAYPVEHEPGTYFVYNSVGTYMLSAIVQKVTGEKVLDYLTPRLFEPLGIEGATWSESPQGINAGGWGLYLKTEDLAKMGQFLLQKGSWNGKQLLPAEWVEEATSKKTESLPAGMKPEDITPDYQRSDWVQGYCYQMWRCRHGAVRADGANGQYILLLPEQDAVVAMTAHLNDMQAELNQVWDYILPAL